ncbi:hypothetical protein ACEPPU_05650 [Priestia aryabhattai]|uniref:hypothetical protein n=1 Tax=Priestia aryabhattai TaxID=412384 RepID=UPI0035ABBDFB
MFKKFYYKSLKNLGNKINKVPGISTNEGKNEISENEIRFPKKVEEENIQIQQSDTKIDSRSPGEIDDTARIKRAILKAADSKSEIKLPVGKYVVSDTLFSDDQQSKEIKITGASEEGVVIKTRLTGITPLFSFRNNQGIFNGITLENVTIEPDEGYEHGGTALYLDGQCYGQFRNINISKLNYGIWLHNNTPGLFTESNRFEQINIRNCNESIRIEQGNGTDSFHGNDFEGVHLNIYNGQIGLNHISGYLYNARVNLFMWGHGAESVYINADGNAERNVGNITYESFFEPAQITGKGKFWFSGFFQGIGGLVNNTIDRDNGQEVFASNNYWKERMYGNTNFNTSALQEKNQKYNGSDGFFYRFYKNNVESILLNTYSGSNENGFYLGSTGYRKHVENGNLGLFLSSLGNTIKSFFQSGLSIKTADDQTAITFKNGRFTGNPGKSQTVAVTANEGVKQAFTFSGYGNRDVFYLASLRISGSNFESRKTYIVNHNGFGSQGSLTQLSSHLNLPASGVSIDSISVDKNGNVVVILTTNRNLTIDFKAMGIGAF